MINSIGIIGGTGKMGSAFKKKFEEHSFTVLVSDENSLEIESEILENSDWIILSVPIDKTLEVYKFGNDREYKTDEIAIINVNIVINIFLFHMTVNNSLISSVSSKSCISF